MKAPDYERVLPVVDDKALEEIKKRAQNAFWETVAGAFADQVKTGDFPPDLTFAFDEDCKRAIAWWLTFNHAKIMA